RRRFAAATRCSSRIAKTQAASISPRSPRASRRTVRSRRTGSCCAPRSRRTAGVTSSRCSPTAARSSRARAKAALRGASMRNTSASERASIYFDNAATSFPKPPEVTEAMARFLAEDAANPGRGGHRMAIRAERIIDDARAKLARLVNGSDPRRLVFTLNCTDALNIAIHGVLGDGPAHVVTTVLEHNSVSRPLQALADSGRIELTRVGCDGAGFVDPDDIRRALRSDTRLVAMTHASNVLGTVQDAA